MHEHGKQGGNELVGQFFKEKAGEIRHGQNSYYLETHLFGDLWPGVISMATGIAHYAGTCPADYKKGQGLFSPFGQVTFEEIKELPDGAAKVGWRKATSGLFTRVAQTVFFRPNCIWAGGETELTNDEEDDGDE